MTKQFYHGLAGFFSHHFLFPTLIITLVQVKYTHTVQVQKIKNELAVKQKRLYLLPPENMIFQIWYFSPLRSLEYYKYMISWNRHGEKMEKRKAVVLIGTVGIIIHRGHHIGCTCTDTWEEYTDKQKQLHKKSMGARFSIGLPVWQTCINTIELILHNQRHIHIHKSFANMSKCQYKYKMLYNHKHGLTANQKKWR